VLEISRIEAGRHNLSLEPVRIGRCCTRPLRWPGRWRAGARRARARAEPADDLFVHGRPAALSQVMLNLLSNAIKYNRAGGRVRLRCELG
jgi:signal transduction histidine kinase